MLTGYDYLIVGAGFAGAVLAERLASQRGKRVLVVDKRDHLAGNAHDRVNRDGVLVHAYGPHYFRTNSDRIVAYLSQFTDWIDADYRILSCTHGRYWPFPINLNTFEQLIGRASSSREMADTLAQWAEPCENPVNSEQVIVSQVGRRLYEMFYRGYTRKQWQRDPRELDASVCGRIPIRTDRDDRYVSEKFQKMPALGYTAMFQRMLDHPRIDVRLGVDYRDLRGQVRVGHTVYTGPIDEYFGCCYGKLPYRSLRFEHTTYACERYQPVVQVNYPNDHDYTRTVEFKHVTGQQLPVTTVTREYPAAYGFGNEPYYPVPTADSRALYEKYEQRARHETAVTFVGRLATYRYYNMDQVVGSALAAFDKLAGADAATRSRAA